MKNVLVLSTFLLIVQIMTISGQENSNGDNSKHSPWSVLIFYSPQFEFSFNPSAYSKPYKDFLLGFDSRIERKVDTERVSLSLGVNYRFKRINHHNPDKNENVTILEFPIQVNYHLKKTVKRFDPFLKSSIRICRFKSNYYGSEIPGALSNSNYLDYQPIIDFGYGFFTKINNNINFLFESSLGYGLTNNLPNRVYLDLLIGIKFKL